MRDMNCPTCHQPGKIHKGKYHYTESGLQNVWLMGVEIFECGCGENFAFIPFKAVVGAVPAAPEAGMMISRAVGVKDTLPAAVS